MDNKLTDLLPLTSCPLLARLDLSNNQKLTLDSLVPLVIHVIIVEKVDKFEIFKFSADAAIRF
jgi:hypothetical protein